MSNLKNILAESKSFEWKESFEVVAEILNISKRIVFALILSMKVF
jgi:hypothetical protein